VTAWDGYAMLIQFWIGRNAPVTAWDGQDAPCDRVDLHTRLGRTAGRV